jgi:hypothetical protein
MLHYVALVRTDVFLYNMLRLLVTANVASSLPFLLTLSATQRNIAEDDILHSHRRENLKSYNNYNIYKRDKLR